MEIFIYFVHQSQENLTSITVILHCPKCQRNFPLLHYPVEETTTEISFVRREGMSDARINASVAVNRLSLARSAWKLKFMASPPVSITEFAALSVLLSFAAPQAGAGDP